MASKTAVKIILGTHQIGDSSKIPGIIHFDDAQDVEAVLQAFASRGYRELDTSANYPGSESRLGAAGAASRFAIHTKVLSGGPGDLEPAKIELSIARSLAELRAESVETVFLHVPDRQTPVAEQAGAMNDAWLQGRFARFGLSNCTAAEVQSFLDVCRERGYRPPAVYQGQYNAIVRGGEKELFPLLRKHEMAFFAYSPAAGGLFSDQYLTSTRWSDDNVVGAKYNILYGQAPVQDSISVIREAAARHGITGHAATLRWTAFHSALDGKYGDAVLIGFSKIEQIHGSLDALEAGPLPAELADAISALYASVQGSEPAYHL